MGVGVAVGRGVGVNVGVGRGVGVKVGVGVRVGVGVKVEVGTGVRVGVGVKVEVGTGVRVGVGVKVEVGAGVRVGVGVKVEAGAGVCVGAGVKVGAGAGVRVGVGVKVEAGVGVHAGVGVKVTVAVRSGNGAAESAPPGVAVGSRLTDRGTDVGGNAVGELAVAGDGETIGLAADANAVAVRLSDATEVERTAAVASRLPGGGGAGVTKRFGSHPTDAISMRAKTETTSFEYAAKNHTIGQLKNRFQSV